jgi:transcriptional regulator with XRE-family HTH domain
MNIPSRWALLIREARTYAHLTRAEAADRLGVTVQMISRYELGIDNIQVDTLARIGKAMGLDLRLGIIVPDGYVRPKRRVTPKLPPNPAYPLQAQFFYELHVACGLPMVKISALANRASSSFHVYTKADAATTMATLEMFTEAVGFELDAYWLPTPAEN